MFHLAEGTLRRYRDDPLILTTSQRQHFDRCPVCQRRHAAIASDAEGIENFFTMPPAPVNASAALARFQQHVRAEQVQPKSSRWARPGFRLQTKPLAGLAGAAVLVSGLALTPAGSMAQSLLTIFQPKQITTVTFTTGDLRSLPNLRAFGTLQMPRNIGDEQVSTSSQAAQLAGVPVLTPASLPSDVSRSVSYHVVPAQNASFTFSADRVRTWSQTHGRGLPAMSAAMNGSTLTLSTSPAVVAIYGNSQGDFLPSLVIGQMRAPVVRSTGVTVKQLEDYLLNLPGISPQLAAQIRAIGDPTSTLPIPVPVDLAQEHDVQVQGVHGVAIGDSTGLGSVVIWERDGVIYGVGGTLTENEALSIANSLHA